MVGLRTNATSGSPGRETEVAIVGAGPAGCLFAAVLAEAGKAVTVLEAGPAWTLGDLISSQIWARRLKWGGAPVLRGGADPVGYAFANGWGFGGTALHHYGGWPRMRPEDFRMRSRFDRGVDWPIEYEILLPYYDRIQEDVGVAGDIGAEGWRPDNTPYPMPPVPATKQAQIIARGFARMGRTVGPTPVAINTVPYKGRRACIYDGWCDAGCPIGALVIPQVTYLPRAQAAGARFFAGMHVARVMTDGRGRATGLVYFDNEGKRHKILADVIVLAGAAVQNPRLLLNSASPTHPDGLGNSRGLVGRYFVHHTIANIYGFFEEDLHNYIGLTVPTLESSDTYEKNRKDGPFGSYIWGIGMAFKPNDLLGLATSRADIFGEDLHRFMRRATKYLGTMGAMCETLPDIDNRVELAAETDRFGMPLARIVNRFSADTSALWDHASAEGLEIMRAAGAAESWAAPMITTHALGGTRMGDDPAESVADSYGRLHDVPNVYVAGGGLFPTIGAAAPTFTLHALALRAAERLVADWSAHRG